jgi:hypothetical protein
MVDKQLLIRFEGILFIKWNIQIKVNKHQTLK